MRTLTLLPLLLLPVLIGCATAPPRPAAEARSELLEVERAFARASREQGAAAAFAANLAPEAVELATGPVQRGREAIVGGLKPRPGSAFTLNWEPEDAAVAASDDLGYTWGHYTLTSTPEGKPAAIEHGKYLTVWRRDPSSHRWQAIADVGNPD